MWSYFSVQAVAPRSLSEVRGPEQNFTIMAWPLEAAEFNAD